MKDITAQLRLAIRDAVHRSTRKPLQWGGLAGYVQLVAIEEALRQAPETRASAPLLCLAQQVTRTVTTCRVAADDVAAAHACLQAIATLLGYATAQKSADPAVPAPPPRTSAQVRAQMEALLDAHPSLLSHRPAQAALLAAWRRLWRTWGPDLLHCYDIPGVPADNLRLESFFGGLRRHQRRISGRASTRPLRDFGAMQVLFAATSEAELRAQIDDVPLSAYLTQRQRLATIEADRQSRYRLHHDPAKTITVLLQQYASRHAVLAVSDPPPVLQNIA